MGIKTKFILDGASLTSGSDVLEKAMKAPHSVNYGHSGGLPIIAIGPKGGKIVGYNAMHEPIYAGSTEAKKLLIKKQLIASGSTEVEKHAQEWLNHLHIKSNTAPGKGLVVTEEVHKKLHDAFGVEGQHLHSGQYLLSLASLKPHIGHPLKPAPHEMLDYGATMAAGDNDNPDFPKNLHTLQEVPAGKFAGSHGNKLFKAPDGTQYLYKAENPTIARAEEAASRLGQLLLGPGKTQSAKYVQLNGKDGVLIKVVNGEELGPEHKSKAPTNKVMQEHFNDIVGQHVLDWLVSNHDAHGGNFLVTKDGMVGIDKGQAWKFIGQDQLDTNYNPNPSTQVYSFFWNAVQAGKIKGDPLPVLQKVFGSLQKISDEQFKAIIAPYVALRAGHQQVSASEIEKKLVARFHECKYNWEWFLGKVYPNHPSLTGYGPQKHLPITVPDSPVTIPGPASSNFTESPAAKLTIKQPAPVATPVQKPAGWPVKKGTVTVHHPGKAPPEKWPSGYPGPGYQADVEYKGQKFKFYFGEGVSGALTVAVDYPDGKSTLFDSPNKAADSLYLWSNGLSLDMTASEKKAKGISYSATKLLKLKEFEADLKEHGAAITPVEMSPKELEKENLIPEKAPEVKQVATVAKTPLVAPPTLDEQIYAVLQKKAPVQKVDYPKVTISKKGLDSPATLTVLPEGQGFTVTLWNKAKEDFETTPFKSLSSASDHVWVVAQGYQDVADYKEKTGKLKIASGGGWKFWGVKPGEEPKFPEGASQVEASPTPAPPPTPEVQSTDLSSEQHKTLDSLGGVKHKGEHIKDQKWWKDLPVGTKVSWFETYSGKTELNTATKGQMHWSITWPGEESGGASSDKGMAVQMTEALGNVVAVVPPSAKIEEPKEEKTTESDPNWETMPDDDQAVSFHKLPSGTVVKQTHSPEYESQYKKLGVLWENTETGDQYTPEQMANDAASGQYFIQKKPIIPIPTDVGGWTTHKLSEFKELNFWLNMPIGTKVSWNSPTGVAFNAERVDGGPWAVTNGDGGTYHLTHDAIRSHAQINSVDDEIVVKKPKAKETPVDPFKEFEKPKHILDMKGELSSAALEKKTDSGLLAPTLAEKLNVITGTFQKWANTKVLNKDTTMGSKPSGWADWIPPPGVWVEGTSSGKKIWFTTGLSGYESSGNPGDKVTFAIVDENGNFSYNPNGVPSSSAANYLSQVLTIHEGHPTKWDQVFPKGVFAANTNMNDYAAVTPEKAIPDNMHPSDLKGAAATQPVQISVPIIEAFKDLPEVKKYTAKKLKLKPAGTSTDKYWMCIDTIPGMSAEDQIQVLTDICAKLGITPLQPPKANSFGAICTLKASDVLGSKTQVVVEAHNVPAIESSAPEVPPMVATSGPDISEELKNLPKKIFKSWSASKQMQVLNALPAGTIVTLGDGKTFKVEASSIVGANVGKFVSTEDPNNWCYAYGFSQKITWSGGAIISAPSNTVSVAKPKVEQKTAPVKIKKSEDQLAKEAAAAATASWAKAHLPVTDQDTLHQLAYLKQKMAAQPFYARIDDPATGLLLLGDGTSSFGVGLKSAGVQYETVESPIGPLFKVSIDSIKNSLGPITSKITGPDGNQYPYGTTFEVQKHTNTVEVMLSKEEGFNKVVPHNSNPNAVMLKWAGKDANAKANLKAALAKYEVKIPFPDPIVGQYNLLTEVPKAELAKIHTTSTVVPKIPKQPSEFISKGIAGLASAQAGALAVNNHTDLSNIASVVPDKFGNSIRMGKAGIFRDGHIYFRKVKDADGQLHYEFSGDISGLQYSKLTKLSTQPFNDKIKTTATKNHATEKDGYGTAVKVHNYSPETGIQVEGHVPIVTTHGIYECKFGTTNAGSQVLVPNNFTTRETFIARISAKADVEKELAECLQKLGVDPQKALAVPDEKDDRLLKKSQVLRSMMGVEGYNTLLNKPELLADENYLDQKLAEYKATDLAESAEIRYTVGHFPHVVITSSKDEEKRKKAGIQFGHLGASEFGIFAQLTEGLGFTTKKVQMLNGILFGGNGLSSDFENGGAEGTMARIATTKLGNNPISGVGGERPQVIFHPRVSARTDYYIHNSDSYGSKNPNGGYSSHYNMIKNRDRYESISKITSTSNEFLFEHGLGTKDVAGVVCLSSSQRKTILDHFKKAGIGEVNGIPVDKFVIVKGGSGGFDREWIVNNLHGLQEGVLP